MNMPPGPADRLFLFTRYPQPGTTKTRLIGALGATGAADLQRRMTVHVLEQVRRLAAEKPLQMEIRYEGGDEDRMKRWLGADLEFVVQGRGDIGRRMARAFRSADVERIKKSIIIGADIPGITQQILNQAFNLLDRNDLVLGPAKDGGYYLIGLRSSCVRKAVPALLDDMSWGTSSVLKTTLQRAEASGLTHALVALLGDVDRPEDMGRWEKIASKKLLY